MKKTLLVLVLGLGMGVAAHATAFGVFPISPQGTFLRQSSNDICSEYNTPGCSMAPTFINLVSLGIQAGDTITITGVGGLCFYAGLGCTVYPPDLGALFSTSNTLLDPSSQNRLPGAINPGAGAILIGVNPNLNTYAGNLDTTIPQDFYIPATVIVPSGANYLVVGVLDSAYSDNSSTFLGVNINDPTAVSGTSSVPEPSTFAMMLPAIGAFWLLRRHPRAVL